MKNQKERAEETEGHDRAAPPVDSHFINLLPNIMHNGVTLFPRGERANGRLPTCQRVGRSETLSETASSCIRTLPVECIKPSSLARREACGPPLADRVICPPISALPRRRVFGSADHSGSDRNPDRAGAAQE